MICNATWCCWLTDCRYFLLTQRKEELLELAYYSIAPSQAPKASAVLSRAGEIEKRREKRREEKRENAKKKRENAFFRVCLCGSFFVVLESSYCRIFERDHLARQARDNAKHKSRESVSPWLRGESVWRVCLYM
jgi:hypothetical protein